MSAARDERLRIAVVAPPWFEVPLNGYGGIERVCAALVDGLVERGRDVTLIAGRPPTQARFIPALPEPPPGLGTVEHPVQEVRWAAAVAPVLEELEMDLVHDHSLTGPLLGLGRARPTVVTAHGPVDGWVGDYYRHLGLPLVALSEAQRAAAEDLPRVGVVTNAVDVRRLAFRSSKEEFALFDGPLLAGEGRARRSGRRGGRRRADRARRQVRRARGGALLRQARRATPRRTSRSRATR